MDRNLDAEERELREDCAGAERAGGPGRRSMPPGAWVRDALAVPRPRARRALVPSDSGCCLLPRCWG